MEKKLLQAITNPLSLHWPFFTIFHHLCLLMCDPLIPLPLLLTKMFSPGAVAKISMEIELLQSIMPPFPAISLKIEFLVIFQPFSTICACLWATP